MHLMAKAKHASHLVEMAWQHHQQRHHTVSAETVALIRPQVLLAVQDFQVGECVTQLRNQRRLVYPG
ncbi:hypothetical protein D3C87_1814800 [compost metagenome]